MPAVNLPFRQVHLDFHTSEAIPDIGAHFDANEFASLLDAARVNSITCFARCHHGWMYYNTKKFPERRHPNLKRNLLEEQIEACHARGIRVPIYTTVQWDHYTAERHPEWLVITETGAIRGTPPYQPGFYRQLCLNSPYTEFLKEHVQEILELLPVDGLFLDIVQPQDCSCRYCRTAMAERGLDPSKAEDRRAFGRSVVERFKLEMTRFIRQFNSDCTIFYNAGHIGPRDRAAAAAYSHFEIESLPSGGWGYMHFPLAVRFARRLGKPCLGMTGRFHTTWGDFHSYKNRAALQFECFRMLALGARCSVGDQLHPSGRMDRAAYELIGSVYAEVERKEPWCEGAEPVVDVGLFTMEAYTGERVPPAVAGAAAMLQAGGHQFDIVDAESPLDLYRVLILPDTVPVTDRLADKLQRFVAQGGALLASYRSGYDESGNAFLLGELLGIEPKGDAPFEPDFLVPRGAIARGLTAVEHVMYRRGMQVAARPEAQVLADVAVPYFNRTYQHFCSHQHAPSSGQVRYPGVVQKGRAIYLAHPVFELYHRRAPAWCKRLVLNALELLLPEPVVRVQGPSTLLVTVNEQKSANRWVVHLLHYIPERRGVELDVIEDVVPVYNIEVSLQARRTVASVECVPERRPLAFKVEGDRVHFTVPEVRGHQMIAVQFDGA